MKNKDKKPRKEDNSIVDMQLNSKLRFDNFSSARDIGVTFRLNSEDWKSSNKGYHE